MLNYDPNEIAANEVLLRQAVLQACEQFLWLLVIVIAGLSALALLAALGGLVWQFVTPEPADRQTKAHATTQAAVYQFPSITRRITMKKIALLSAVFFVFTLAAQAQTPAPTPAPRPINVVVVNYMKAKGAIVGVHRELWLPIHKESIKEGKMAAWSSWTVKWAAKNSEYDFVTLDAFKSWNDLERAPWTNETWAKVHPNVKLEDVGKRTNEARDIVRRDVLHLIAETAAAPNAPTAKYLIVDFYQVAPGKEQEYAKLERETYLPLHQEAVKRGRMVSWQFYAVRNTGNENNYRFITVRGYAKWEEIGQGGGPDVLAKVHPNLKAEDLAKQMREARTRAKSQILTLVDQAPPVAGGQ